MKTFSTKMQFLTQENCRKLQIFSLYMLGLTMPVFETPMHIAFILFALGSIGVACYTRPKFGILDLLLLGMALTALISTIVNWPEMVNGQKGLRNNLTLYLLFWGCLHANFSGRQLKRFCWYVCGGTLMGLILGAVKYIRGKTPNLELYSAGVVTQSSVYLAITYFVLLGILLDNSGLFSSREKKVAAGGIAVTLAGLLIMGSRGAILALVLTHLLLLPLYWKHKTIRRLLFGGGAMAALVIGIAMTVAVPAPATWKTLPAHQRLFYSTTSRVQHLVDFLTSKGPFNDPNNSNDLIRYENWEIGLTQALSSKHPWFGIGPRNYESINIEALHIQPPLKTYPGIWQHLQHAHNLFLTKWCEEGLVGLFFFVCFLFVIFLRQYTFRSFLLQHYSWLLVAGIGALAVPVTAGLFSSPFRNEFAWLAMLLTGLNMNLVNTAT